MEKNLVSERNETYYQIIGNGEEGYDEQVLIRGKIENILPLKLRWVDGKKEYLYDITEKISLRDYIKREVCDKEMFHKILQELKKASVRLKEYLLDEQGIVLSPDSVFWEPAINQWKFVYCREMAPQYWRGMSSLVEGVLEQTTEGNDEFTFWLYQLHTKANEEMMTLEKFCREEKIPTDIPEQKKEPAKKREVRAQIPVEIPAFSQEDNKLWIPVVMAVAGVGSLLVLWENHVFVEKMTGELKSGMLIGTVLLFLVVVGVGIWRTWPISQRKKTAEFQDMGHEKRKLCLIPQKPGGEMMCAENFPFECGDTLRIVKEDAFLYIINRESRAEVYKNGVLLIPWNRERLADGDIIEFEQGEFVVELS